MKHVPVLLDTVLEIINPKPGMFCIDGTLDGGGHAEAIMERMFPSGIFLGVDLDGILLRETKERLEGLAVSYQKDFRAVWQQGSYTELPKILHKNNLSLADALLLDFGFSSEQMDMSGRGFSFQRDEVLDMRYDTHGNDLSAAFCINSYDEDTLEDIFRTYGEERFARKIAKHIIIARRKNPITTSGELARVVEEVVWRRGKIHPATKVFQALRIFVNKELENISEILRLLDSIVKKGGVIVIISFHSLEDRLVKHAFKQLVTEGKAIHITKKAIQAGIIERRGNPRSRSAKLRAIQIL
ncbi:MAG: 16S rRNA (cytosine(1402)-N(4))-methyltransferase RsmH [bacterium]